MNYIQQGFTGKIGLWKYVVFAGLFFGFLGLNFLGLILLKEMDPEFDMNTFLKKEILEKGANRFLAENLLPFAVGLFVLLFWVKFVHKQTITSLTTSRKKIDWKRIFFAFLLWASITVLFTLVAYLFTPENFELNFNLNKFLVLAIIGILLIPLQTSFEEYFFRGYLMQGIGIIAKNRWIPLVVTSFVFGLLHIANPEVSKMGFQILIYYIGTGFFLGVITLMDEGLELAIGFHAANNLITALLVTANWTVFQTNSVFIDISEPNLVSDVYVPVFILYPVLIFLFTKKYKWNNWKGKLTGKIEELVKN